VLLEAMAVGLPVVSTAVMGTRDIVGPRRGALAPDDNERDFAVEIVRLIRDPELRASLSRQACDYAREWHADALARRMAALYAEVREAGPGARR
jgi:1,2-diacylglycerol 3-alpha-glucosyltransferase